MTSLHDLADWLIDRGLFVYEEFESPELFIGLLGQEGPMPDNRDSYPVERCAREVCVQRHELPDGRVVWINDETWVEQRHGDYLFRNELVNFGLPHPESIACVRDSLQSISRIVGDYYFRPPVVLKGWAIPVFQHPDWVLSKLAHAVENATEVTYSRVKEILTVAAADYHQKSLPAKVLYYPALENANDGSHLYLRRDGLSAVWCKRPTAEEVDAYLKEFGKKMGLL